MALLGYRIYFDGKRFAMDDYKTPVRNERSDGTVQWNAEYSTAHEAVQSLNSKLKRSIKEFKKESDFVVKVCKDCGEYFIVTKQYADWFIERNLSVPCRCDICRSARKKATQSRA